MLWLNGFNRVVGSGTREPKGARCCRVETAISPRPIRRGAKIRAIDGDRADVHRRDRLGSLIHEYSIAA